MAGKAMLHRSIRAARVAISLAIALGMQLVATSPAAAADLTPPELVDVTLSTNAVRVAGLGFKVVTVSVHLTDDTGVVRKVLLDENPGTHGETVTPAVILTREDPDLSDIRWLSLSSGTPKDGIWTADFLVPSTYDGSWRVGGVSALDEASNFLDIDPATIGIARTLKVTGTHQPRLTFRFVEAMPGPRPFRGEGRLTFSDTGRPISGQVLFVGIGPVCEFLEDRWLRVTTNADGRYSFRLPAHLHACVHLVAPVPDGRRFDYWTVARIITRLRFPSCPEEFACVSFDPPAARPGDQVTITSDSEPGGDVGVFGGCSQPDRRLLFTFPHVARIRVTGSASRVVFTVPSLPPGQYFVASSCVRQGRFDLTGDFEILGLPATTTVDPVATVVPSPSVVPAVALLAGVVSFVLVSRRMRHRVA